MINIVALLQCVERRLTAKTIKRLSCVINGMLVMTGRVTMFGDCALVRPKGDSYRTV